MSLEETTKKVIRIYGDASHAWCAVPVEELKELNIAHLISGYSYHRNDIAYLEEDCDLGIYMNRLKELHPDMEFIFKEEHTNRESHIRNYKSYLLGTCFE